MYNNISISRWWYVLKLSMMFGLLCIVCIGLYATLWALVSGYPETATGFSFLMIPLSFGGGAFFILAIVMLILKK